MLIGQICDFGNDGDAHYRLHAPSMQLGKIPGITAVDSHFLHPLLYKLIEHADVLVLQFVNDWDLLSICDYRRSRGKVTIFEANDYFFDLQPWNPIAANWSDRETQELYKRLLSHADGVQTSTEFLADKWHEMGARKVAVFKNHLVQVPDLAPLPPRPFTIGWAGSPGHFADLLHIAPTLQNWLASHPETRLAIMTNELARSFFHLPQERFIFRNFGSLEQYLDFLKSLDVGLAPLLPTDYNRGRSDVKFLEYSSQGVPGIYQNLNPYQGIVRDGVHGMLFHSTKDLATKLDLLYADANLRNRIREQAYEFVHGNRILANNIQERLAWYRSFENKGSQSRQGFLAELEPFKELSDSNYCALRAGENEKQLLNCLPKNNAGEDVCLLQGILQKQPDHVPALIILSQRLNDAKQSNQALQLEPKLRELAPFSVKWQMEINRALYLRDNTQAAVQGFRELTSKHPGHVPTWKYYLRLLAITKNSASTEEASACLEAFPDCHPLAMIAVGALSPGDRILALKKILERTRAKLALFEHHHALRLLRSAVMECVKNLPPNAETISLLATACEVFPESMQLKNQLALQLQQTGQLEEALEEFSQLAKTREIQLLGMEEFPQEPMPYLWQFASFIKKVLEEKDFIQD